MAENNWPQKLGWVLALIAVAVVMPLGWYGLRVGRAPSILAPAAIRLVDGQKAVLVDVGVAPELAIYLTNAVKWPGSSVMEAHTAKDLPRELRGKKLLLICTAGMRSPQAALHLQGIGVDAASVRGGAQQYVCAVPGCSRSVLLRGDPVTDAAIPAFRESPVHEQWAVVLAFFGIKCVYSLLSVAIVVM
ncbi:MAG: rhodanese-like domain-containing protein, partial [Verrucomicrobia bacterium]|nr:rhodanese-like domain-containing protein [Verrucomicrobiota bacterium]